MKIGKDDVLVGCAEKDCSKFAVGIIISQVTHNNGSKLLHPFNIKIAFCQEHLDKARSSLDFFSMSTSEDAMKEP